jgi:2-polyprenyl-3-methyl-5-hydroxy-6-metoxy-1,4-benzoquinol methylase
MASIVDERGYNQSFKPTPAQTIRLQRRSAALVREMRLPDATEERARIHILELGCGMGEMALQLAQLTGARVTGVDLSPKFIEHAAAAHTHPNLRFIVADLSNETPGSEEEQYHYIVGNGILHHLYYHLDSFLPVLARWLVPGGRLIFWEPNLYNPYIYLIFSFSFFRRLARLEPDEMAFTAAFIRRKLTAAGFHDVEVDTRDFLLPNTPAWLIGPVVALSRGLERIPLVRCWAQSVFLRAKH